MLERAAHRCVLAQPGVRQGRAQEIQFFSQLEAAALIDQEIALTGNIVKDLSPFSLTGSSSRSWILTWTGWLTCTSHKMDDVQLEGEAVESEVDEEEITDLVMSTEGIFREVADALATVDANTAEDLLIKIEARRIEQIPGQYEAVWQVAMNAAEVLARIPIAAAYQWEADYRRLEDTSKQILSLAKATQESLDRIPSREAELLKVPLEVFATFCAMAETLALGIDKSAASDRALFRGDISAHLRHLEAAIGSYKPGLVRLARLRDNAVAKQFIPTINRIRRSLERRVTNLSAQFRQESRYVAPTGDKVFVVHGHAGDRLKVLVHLINKTGYETLVLKEQAVTGRTLMDRFQQYANDCFCMFCLITPDDAVEDQEGNKYKQGRPNVFFELGWFYGRFGPESLCLVKDGASEIPSDLNGILTLKMQGDNIPDLGEALKAMRVRAGRIDDHGH